MSIIGDIARFGDGENIQQNNFSDLTVAMMTGSSLPNSSNSSTASSNGSNSLRNHRLPTNEDQFVDDLVSRLINEDAEDDLVTGLNSLLKRTLSDFGENGLAEQQPSPLLSKHWSSQPTANLQPRQPPFRHNNAEPLKVITNNEFLSDNFHHSHHQHHHHPGGHNRHHDSGYISPSMPHQAPGSGKAFFDNSTNQPFADQQHRVDPLILQQMLQNHQHPKQQMMNHRPITGGRNHRNQHQGFRGGYYGHQQHLAPPPPPKYFDPYDIYNLLPPPEYLRNMPPPMHNHQQLPLPKLPCLAGGQEPNF